MPARNARFVLSTLTVVLLAGACGDEVSPQPSDGPAVQTVVREPASTVLLDSPDPAELALTASQQIFERSPVAVVAGSGADLPDGAVRALHAAAAESLGAPALLVGGAVSDRGVSDELDRLGARVAVVVRPGADPGEADSASPEPLAAEAARAAGVEVVTLETPALLPGSDPGVEPLSEDEEQELRDRVDAALADGRPSPASSPAARLTEVLALTDPRPGQEAAIATLRAAGAVDHEVPGGDIAGAPEVIEHVDSVQALAVVGVGPTFGSAEEFAWRVAAAERGELLPTGTQQLLPARYVSVEGGRRDDPAAVVDAAAAAADTYAGLEGGPVVPTVVVQASAAAGHEGEDGDWVAEEPPAELEPLVDAARDAGQFVLLDVGAGMSTLREEVEPLEDLLARPGVGVMLHPEDRRSDGEQPPGQVSAAEVEDVVRYIEGVITNHGLPPTMVVLHQTRPESVVDRDQLGRTAAGTEAVELVVAADRTGGLTTTEWVWGRVTDGLPDGVHAGWAGPEPEYYRSVELVPTDPAPLLVTGS
ncbi:hypothetical protein [Isoptericola sp. 178]|uniref:hypothetical protein n=1 Tax=Isoptericola sp. 178 TaxID=3064651 RepID=UPI002712F75F|nr:hypothetical protein [Isoptericola sp. 178]MDO8144004.1 hypothetical protein [Isoptericola sp. 178]